ncbi:ABC transporter substrate-binding protein [Kordiimonas pumila]|uniref:ABC transporter substrate-binding protein n=1 Tax=Kordiimonas pumila TaxID=2161677 RepID=A0ABV7D251_9PROT|nr:ABC transporter substrate-binding protein [Kordiimonas pumila]
MFYRTLPISLVLSLLSALPHALAKDEAVALTFATDWKAQAEHGGFYQALAKDYYKNLGLNIKIRSGGPQTDNPRLMAAGALDIAIASNNFQPINLITAGAGVTVVMASFQKDPQVLMAHPETKAETFADFKGLPIFLSDSAIATFWPWLKAKFYYRDTQIRKYTYSLAPWLVNKQTIQEGYLSSEPFSAQKAGVNPKVLLFADAGYPGYSGMVMVRNVYLEKHPDVIKAFVAASIKGWQDFIWGDASAGSALILKDNPEMTQELINYAIDAMKKNTMLGNKHSVGSMTHERWLSFVEEMASLGLIESNFKATSAYSLEYLPAKD